MDVRGLETVCRLFGDGDGSIDVVLLDLRRQHTSSKLHTIQMLTKTTNGLKKAQNENTPPSVFMCSDDTSKWLTQLAPSTFLRCLSDTTCGSSNPNPNPNHNPKPCYSRFGNESGLCGTCMSA